MRREMPVGAKAFWVIAVGMAGVLLPVAHAHAALLSVIPSADTFVSAANPSGNYGAGGALEVSPAAASNGEFQALMRFDLSSVKAGLDSTFGAGQWTVQSVTLRLAATPINNVIFNANSAGQFSASWMANDAWTEGTGSPNTPTTDGVTYNTLPSFLSVSDQAEGTFIFAGGTSGSATYSLNLGTGLVNDIESGSSASLRLFAADNAVSYLFNSRSFGTAANRPLLSVTAVPEPAMSLMGIAAAAMMMTRHRRKRSI